MDQVKIKAHTIITGHNNADFDALAAMIAASKLYPGGILIFPGSQEKSLREFFIQSATYLFNFRTMRDIEPESVKRLVVVDTRQRSRLSHVHQVLDNPDLEIVGFDHHPDSEDDLKFDQMIVRPWGATTSIILSIIRNQNTFVSPDEATLMGCGIYEDTGAFTYNSTTEHDLMAAAWLRERGMDLNVISDLLARELNAEQVAILNTLLETGVTHDINGVAVVIAEVSLDHYVGDFSLLVHKMLEMQNIRVLFALGRMLDRIHVVARSRTPDVNVGEICASMGGGGHAYAASATVKERTMAQAKDDLFTLLYSHIHARQVQDLMSRPAITVKATDTIGTAVEIMSRYGFKAILITNGEDRTCAGYLEHQIADKALAHGLGDIEVSEYMQRDCSEIAPDADIHTVMEIIVGKRQRIVPVTREREIIGVITRTDLINTLIEEPARIPESLIPEKKRERNVTTVLRERLPKDVFAMLVRAGELAENLGAAVYAVGGFVRDILLQRTNLDLDLVVEGDAVAFARALAKQLDGRVRVHMKFKTAVVIYGNDQHIDVATARLEYYEYPAALPTVELSSIKMDLYRRDFTVNALAVQLNPGSFGRLVDFFNSQRDVKSRVIRVLHSLSFVEDPTRILRAIRFEQRFNFRIGKQTERLIKNALKLDLLHHLSGSRLFNELRLMLEEKNPLAEFRRMQEFGILHAIHPDLDLGRNAEILFEEIEKVLNWYRLLYMDPAPRNWMVYLLGLCLGWSQEEARNLSRRLNLSKRIENEFLILREQTALAHDKLIYWHRSGQPLSNLHAILQNIALEGDLLLMAQSTYEAVRKHISLYVTELRHITLDVTGNDLISLGIPSGPGLGRVLERLHAAKLDGQAPDKNAQIALAKEFSRKQTILSKDSLDS